jgi:hypothetical protein
MNRYDILLGRDTTDSEPPRIEQTDKFVVVGTGNMESAIQIFEEMQRQPLFPTYFDLSIPDPPVTVLTPVTGAERVVALRIRLQDFEPVERRERQARKKRPEPWRHGRKKDPWEK